jgi:hypothetical protein
VTGRQLFLVGAGVVQVAIAGVDFWRNGAGSPLFWWCATTGLIALATVAVVRRRT